MAPGHTSFVLTRMYAGVLPVIVQDIVGQINVWFTLKTAEARSRPLPSLHTDSRCWHQQQHPRAPFRHSTRTRGAGTSGIPSPPQ